MVRNQAGSNSSSTQLRVLDQEAMTQGPIPDTSSQDTLISKMLEVQQSSARPPALQPGPPHCAHEAEQHTLVARSNRPSHGITQGPLLVTPQDTLFSKMLERQQSSARPPALQPAPPHCSHEALQHTPKPRLMAPSQNSGSIAIVG